MQEMLAQIAYSFAIVVVWLASWSVCFAGGAQQGKIPNSRDKVDKSFAKADSQISQVRSSEIRGTPKRNVASKSLPDIPLNDHYPKHTKKRFQVKRKSKNEQRKTLSAETNEKKEEKKEELKPVEPKSTEKAVKKSAKGTKDATIENTKEMADSGDKKVKTARSANRSATSDQKKSAKRERTKEIEEFPADKTCADVAEVASPVTPTSPRSPPPPEHASSSGRKSETTPSPSPHPSSAPDSIREVSAIEATTRTEVDEKECAIAEKKAKIDDQDATEFENRGANPAIARMKKYRRETNDEKPKESEKENTEFETINTKARPARPKMKTHKAEARKKDEAAPQLTLEVPKS